MFDGAKRQPHVNGQYRVDGIAQVGLSIFGVCLKVEVEDVSMPSELTVFVKTFEILDQAPVSYGFKTSI